MNQKESYLTIAKDETVEKEIKKSRFLTHVKRVETENEAKEFINQIKKEHWKANHNCSAFILGQNMEIQRSSDDGEPSGTAGVPMLEVLKKNELINLVVVVTRYFGGIKLGAGGLIRAYAGCVAEAISEIGIVKGVLQKEVVLTVSYSNVDKVQKFLAENAQFYLKETDYQEEVNFTIYVERNLLQTLVDELTDLLNGSLKITENGELWIEIAQTNRIGTDL